MLGEEDQTSKQPRGQGDGLLEVENDRTKEDEVGSKEVRRVGPLKYYLPIQHTSLKEMQKWFLTLSVKLQHDLDMQAKMSTRLQ